MSEAQTAWIRRVGRLCGPERDGPLSRRPLSRRALRRFDTSAYDMQASLQSGQTRIQGRLLNLSAGGCCIGLPLPPALHGGRAITVTLCAEGYPTLACPGSISAVDAGTAGASVRVRFHRLESEPRRALAAWIGALGTSAFRRRAREGAEGAGPEPTGAAGEPVGGARRRGPRRVTLAPPLRLLPYHPALDFGVVDPAHPAPVRTFHIISTSAHTGTIECRAGWVRVSPRTFGPGRTAVEVHLHPTDGEPGQGEALLYLSVPEQTVYCPIRYRLKQPQPVDLVCIVDVIGGAHEIDRRRAYAAELIAQVRAQLGDDYTLRTGLVAYADRNHLAAGSRLPGSPPVWRHDLSPPESALDALARLKPAAGQDFEAALEEALATLDGLAWAEGSRRMVVTIGSRPPHPYKPAPGRRQIGSPSGHDWHGVVAAARERLRMRSICVVCPIVWPAGRLPAHAVAYADSCWDILGYSGVYRYSTTPPGAVAAAIVAAVGNPEA